jgi:DNA-binding MurR/RpiR family transcriptional regulator
MPTPQPGQRAPGSVDELRIRILGIEGRLPKRLRQCARFVLENPERIAVSTVAELAEASGVRPSAFVRFCQAVGFSGFSEMQRLFRGSYTQRWPDYATRLDRLRSRGGSQANLLGDFIEAGHKSLNLLSEMSDVQAFEQAVLTLKDASGIHVIGLRRSFPVAAYLAYMLDRMMVPVALQSAAGGVLTSGTTRPGDVLIAISFSPCSEETLAIARQAQERSVQVIGITDVMEGPISEIAQVVLAVSEVDVGAFRSMSATLALVAALAIAVGTARGNS